MEAIFSYLVAAVPALILALIALPTAYLLLKRRRLVIRIVAAPVLAALVFAFTWQCLGGVIFISLQDSRPQPFLKPSISQFPGTWRMPRDLVDYLHTKGISSPSNELVLQEAGTFEMTDIPNLWGAVGLLSSANIRERHLRARPAPVRTRRLGHCPEVHHGTPRYWQRPRRLPSRRQEAPLQALHPEGRHGGFTHP
jgi:hypothetical protein